MKRAIFKDYFQDQGVKHEHVILNVSDYRFKVCPPFKSSKSSFFLPPISRTSLSDTSATTSSVKSIESDFSGDGLFEQGLLPETVVAQQVLHLQECCGGGVDEVRSIDRTC